MYIFKEKECEEKFTSLKKTLASLKWMPDLVREEEELRATT
jgi:hypothetical protein